MTCTPVRSGPTLYLWNTSCTFVRKATYASAGKDTMPHSTPQEAQVMAEQRTPGSESTSPTEERGSQGRDTAHEVNTHISETAP